MLDTVECLRSLLIHLLREAEVGYADDIVAANLRCVRLQLLVCEVHLTQGFEDAVEINLTLAHSGVLVDGVVSTATLVQPGRIYDVAAVLGLVPGVSQKNVGQLIAGVLQHVANVALALIVEEAVGCGDDVVDDLFMTVKKEIIEIIHNRPDDGDQATDLLMVAKYFERIGDHATNIAEWVIFSITGER